jgi:voltage-gated potassium channel
VTINFRQKSADLAKSSRALQRFRRRLLVTLAYFNVVLLGGAVGYRVIEGWSWFDSLYMSVITATCVGYSEVHGLSNAGRFFTMVLLAFALVGLGLLWAMVTAFLVELDLADFFRRRGMQKRIDELSGHYVVCGAGRVGRVIFGEMMAAGHPVVILDRDHDRIEHLRELHPGALSVEGDATRDHVLELAGVRRAKGLAAALASDADNLFVTLTARTLNTTMEIACRANDGESVAKMSRAGANHIISPNVTGGMRMATALMRPSIVNFLDATTSTSGFELQLEELTVPAGSGLVGKRLMEARIPQETGLIVLALRPAGGKASAFNPGPEARLGAGDAVIVLGESEQIDRLRSFLGAA